MNIETKITKFSELVRDGVLAWVKAGELLCKLIEQDPQVFEKIHAKNPWMTYDVLNGFVRIGRQEVYPYLMLDQTPGARRLMDFPYDDQKELYHAEIPVAVLQGSEIVTKTKRVQEMTRRDVEVAFCERGIRSLAEQRKIVHPAKRGSNTFKRDMFDPNPDDETPANDEPDAESESIDENLSKAQAAILKVREILGEKNTPKLEKHITNALNAIGGLRFELKDAKPVSQNGSRMREAIAT